jgi:hypothetical protein
MDRDRWVGTDEGTGSSKDGWVQMGGMAVHRVEHGLTEIGQKWG